MNKSSREICFFRLASLVILPGLLLSVVMPLNAAAGDLDRDSVIDIIRRRDALVQSMPTPSNSYDKEAQEKAAEIMENIHSGEFQERLRAQTEKLKSTVFKDHVASFSTTTTADRGAERPGTLSPDERLYVFVSSSVPLQTLRNYAAAIDKVNDSNIVMVMRGFVGGLKDWSKMIDFSSQVLVKDTLCDTRKERCEMYAANLEVDPLLFRRYDVSMVPTVVYARGVNRMDLILSEGLSDNAKVTDFYSVRGDMALEYLLETIQRETKSASIGAVLSALRRSDDDHGD